MLKAAVLPRLMSAMTTARPDTTRMALTGTLTAGWICPLIVRATLTCIEFLFAATVPQFAYLCNPFGERHAFIASESKQLPRGACHDSDVAEES